MKVLRSRVGLSLLGAAVFDDILIILLLSIFLALQSGTGGTAGVLIIILRMAVFLAASAWFGIWALPWIVRRVAHLPISQGLLTISLVIMLAYGIASEAFGGMAAITGAFLAGLMLARTPEKERIEAGVHALAYGLFVPVFFVNIGLSVNLREFRADAFLMTAAIILVAIAGKWIGSGWGAKMGGLNSTEATQLGAGMISRGEVGLIVASVGMREGLVVDAEFSAIVVMIVVTTIITPPILRWLFSREHQKKRVPVPQESEIEENQSEAS
jgi:Kef-type K+ transport system membrane component KefB